MYYKTNKRRGRFLDAGKEFDNEITEKSSMFMPRLQTTRENPYIRVVSKLFENMAEFEYLETMLRNQNCIFKRKFGRH
jgi:hypothetical protein